MNSPFMTLADNQYVPFILAFPKAAKSIRPMSLFQAREGIDLLDFSPVMHCNHFRHASGPLLYFPKSLLLLLIVGDLWKNGNLLNFCEVRTKAGSSRLTIAHRKATLPIFGGHGYAGIVSWRIPYSGAAVAFPFARQFALLVMF